MIRYVEAKEERKEFSDETIELAWTNAKGQCVSCGKDLVWDNKGRENGRGCWEAHHGPGGRGDNSEKNCYILCWACHKKTMEDAHKSVSERVKEILNKKE